MIPLSLRVGTVVALACVLAGPARAAETFDKNVARRISVDDLKKRMDAGEKPIVLDTRFSLGDQMAKGAVRVPNNEIESWAKGKPKDALIVAYCT
jgi:hypothetical protein